MSRSDKDFLASVLSNCNMSDMGGTELELIWNCDIFIDATKMIHIFTVSNKNEPVGSLCLCLCVIKVQTVETHMESNISDLFLVT